ncbi:Redoxin [Halteromyces radiatus]|uniref:Redoxin n=1 Tax=Halteromyces radiatus TaxID=101107 RepID=UPI002220259F|nr:Redoxin [Halteromyces radiatus]KAI8097410.1 Redoxin [Halteromyces radiatus]
MIKVGDTIPEAILNYVPYDANEAPDACPIPVAYDLHKELKGKKAVIFAVPGAFTPTCSISHVPGFIKYADELKAKGVDVILGTATNDGFVMHAWAKQQGTKDKVVLASDGTSGFFDKLGLSQDLTAKGMGIRAQRFALILDDLKVTYLAVDEAGKFEGSSAEAVLKALN